MGKHKGTKARRKAGEQGSLMPAFLRAFVPLCLPAMPIRVLNSYPIFILSALLLAATSGLALIQAPQPEEDTAWVCPMHSDYTQEVEGKCPRCGMDLVRAAP